MQVTLGQQRTLRQGALLVLLGLLKPLLHVAAYGQLYIRYTVINSNLIGFSVSMRLSIGELWLFKRQFCERKMSCASHIQGQIMR